MIAELVYTLALVIATVVVAEYKGGLMILLIGKHFYNLDQVSLKA